MKHTALNPSGPPVFAGDVRRPLATSIRIRTLTSYANAAFPSDWRGAMFLALSVV